MAGTVAAHARPAHTRTGGVRVAQGRLAGLGAVYLGVADTGDGGDRLIGVAWSPAASATPHESVDEGD